MLDVCVFVEDPGAANYVMDLEQHLSAEGLTSCLLSTGDACSYLAARNVSFEEYSPATTANEVIERIQPRLLLTGTSENTQSVGLDLIDEARRTQIPSVSVVDQVVNADRRFRGESTEAMIHAPDWLVVPDETTSNAFRALGFARDRIVICGHPHFDKVRRRGRDMVSESRVAIRQKILPNLSVERPLWVYVAEGYDRLNPAASLLAPDYTLYGRGNTKFRTAIVLEELLDAIQLMPERPLVVVRLHPKNIESEFTDYIDEVDAFSVGEDPLELVWAADLVVGMTSMLLMEAALLERPTLAILPRASEADWLPNTAQGITPVVTSRKELEQAVSIYPDRQRTTDADQLFLSGALDRIVNLICRLLRG
jgi:hypothetical protein